MAEKKEKKNATGITVIIPVHELNEETTQLFVKACISVEQQQVVPDELMIVVPKGSDVEKQLGKHDFGGVKNITRIVSNDGETDFCSQINFGVEQVETEWFSVLELDDEYSKIWFRNVLENQDAYDDVDMFLPLIVNVSEKTETNEETKAEELKVLFEGLTNEAAWATSFSDELGILDNGALLAFPNFNTDGMVMRTETYEDLGGFKSTMKLTFVYEFLLRMTYNDVKVMIIPKFGYKKLNQREGSLFKTYESEGGMTPVESQFWLAQARKEYFFDEDRKITYVEETE